MILIVTQCFPPDIGGIENLMGGLADNLHKQGKSVAVFADSVRGTNRDKRFPYTVLRYGGPRPLRRWRKRHAIAELARRTPISAVFADSWKSVEALPDLDAPVLTLAHGMEFPVAPAPRKRTRIEIALARSARIIANSQYTKQKVQGFLLSHRSVDVIHPPIERQRGAEISLLDQMDKQLAGRRPLLLTLSRLEPRKGIDRVIEAVAALKHDFPSITYYIAGTGDDLERLERLIARLRLGERVRFLGRVSDEQKAALLSRADLFVMPARQEGNSVEGFGTSYVEAAWYGVPAIAGQDGGGGEAVLHGQTGLICDGTSQDAVTDAITALLSDDDRRRRFGEAAARRAREELQWSRGILRYLALIDEDTMEEAA